MTDQQVREELARIKALLEAATPGPWERTGACAVDHSYHIGTIGPAGVTGMHIDDEHSIAHLVADAWADGPNSEANADCIASSWGDVRFLLQIVTCMERKIVGLQDQLACARREHRIERSRNQW